MGATKESSLIIGHRRRTIFPLLSFRNLGE